MADVSIPPLTPFSHQALPALDALGRARNLARGAHLALASLAEDCDSSAAAVAAILDTVLDELANVEAALSGGAA